MIQYQCHFSGDVDEELRWVASPMPDDLTYQALLRCKQLILDNTGEDYSFEMLQNMPVSPSCGSLLLIPKDLAKEDAIAENEIHGILWAMRLDQQTVRVLTILVDSKHRLKGYAAKAWYRFVQMAIEDGASNVTLEVRQENDIAFDFYSRRGLLALGRLSNYYRDTRGIVMYGPLVHNVA